VTVAVVTDSAAAVPPELAERHGITVVPMWLSVDGDAVREGERALGELLGDARVTTSAPTPGEFEAAIRGALAAGASHVLVLTIASAMSASHHAATVAARDVGDHARVVDTKTAAGAQALVVLAAARAAAAGASFDDVIAAALDVVSRVRLVATVPDLDHLVRSGRVPGIAGWAGRTLGISPLFEFRAGKVHRLRPALGVEAAYDRIVGRFRREASAGARAHVVALHALAPDAADALLARAVGETGATESFTSEFGSVMVVHAGPGLVGLAWWFEPVTPGDPPG
jgi:fatty acid kinase fatty acid binding subunit